MKIDNREIIAEYLLGLCLEKLYTTWGYTTTGLGAAVLLIEDVKPIISTDLVRVKGHTSAERLVLEYAMEIYKYIPKRSILVSTTFGLTEFNVPIMLKEIGMNKVYTGYIHEEQYMFMSLPWLEVKTLKGSLEKICEKLDALIKDNNNFAYTSPLKIKEKIDKNKLFNIESKINGQKVCTV